VPTALQGWNLESIYTSIWVDLGLLSFVCCFELVQALVVAVELVVHLISRLQKSKGNLCLVLIYPGRESTRQAFGLRKPYGYGFLQLSQKFPESIGARARKAKVKAHSTRTKSRQNFFFLYHPNGSEFVLSA
jgi:hypothetical protein